MKMLSRHSLSITCAAVAMLFSGALHAADAGSNAPTSAQTSAAANDKTQALLKDV